MSANDLSGPTALVTGAGRGFGRGARSRPPGPGRTSSASPGTAPRWRRCEGRLGDGFTPVAADAADPVVAGKLTDA